MGKIFSQVLPIMVLPGVVFFPNTSITLFVSEQSYTRMVDSAYESYLPIGIFSTKPGSSHKEMLTSCEKVGTLGQIISFGKPSSGERSIILKGAFLAEIRQLVRITPYPLALMDYWAEYFPEEYLSELEHCLKELIWLVQRFKEGTRMDKVPLPSKDKWQKLFIALTNSVASIIPVNPSKKQEWLSTKDIYERFKRVKEELIRLYTFNKLLSEVPPPQSDPHLN